MDDAAKTPEGETWPPGGFYRRPLLITGFFFLAFLIARLALLWTHPREFASLSAADVMVACLRGLRFDASIIFTVIGIPLLLLMLPFPCAQGHLWQGIWGWVCFAALIFLGLVLGVDVVYFGYVHRHVGAEITFFQEALDAVALSAVTNYLGPLVGFLAAAIGLFWIWQRRVMRPFSIPDLFRWNRVAVGVIAFAFMWCAARGNPTGKRLKIIHAFTGVTPAAAYLTLNGPFSAFFSMDTRVPLRADFQPWPQAMATTQEILFATGEQPVHPDYPLLRRGPGKSGEKPNVVLIMLESWDAFYIDVIRQDLGLSPLGLTPHFDALSKEGLLFTRFYANGQKSMDGISALTCSFPTLPRIPYIGRGMEQSRLSFLGQLGLQESYETFFIQASTRDSFRCDAIAKIGGFTHYLGAQDIPKNTPASGPGVVAPDIPWDHDMFLEASLRLAASRKPFLAFLYTASTHAPCAWPDATWRKYPTNSHEHRYRNSLNYADWAVAQFFKAVKQAGLFERTIFILTADHIAGNGGAHGDDPPTLHHIPCLVIAPGLKPGRTRRIGSQLDVIPTILDLAGWRAPHASLGRSLFDETDRETRGAFCVEGEVILRIEEGGWVAHNLDSRIAARKTSEKGDLDAIERRLLAFLQTAATLLRQNRLYADPDTIKGAPGNARTP